MATNLSSGEYAAEALNVSRSNLREYIEYKRASGEGLNGPDALEVAQLQSEQAKAAALTFIGEQLSFIARALQGVSTPGQSIRYGLADVAQALTDLKSQEDS